MSKNKKQKRLRINGKNFKRAEELCNKAAPGPWLRGDKAGGHMSEVISPCQCCGTIATCEVFGVEDHIDCYHTEFIAESRTLLPRSLQEIKLLNEEIEKKKKSYDELFKSFVELTDRTAPLI